MFRNVCGIRRVDRVKSSLWERVKCIGKSLEKRREMIRSCEKKEGGKIDLENVSGNSGE